MHYAQPAVARHIFSFSGYRVNIKLNAVQPFRLPESCPCIAFRIKVVAGLPVMESGKVPVDIGDAVKCPSDAVTPGVGKRRGVTGMAAVSAVTVDGAVLAGHFPVIVLRAVALSDNPAETALGHRTELLVRLSCQRVGPAVEPVAELLPHEQVALALIPAVEARHAPAGLDVNALHGKAPSIAYKAAAALAAVLQAGTYANIVTSCRNFERTGQRCRTVLIG